MKLLDLTLDSPAENLALDEALLDAAEADARRDDVLRLWEPASHFVVVGRSSHVDREVNASACSRTGVPILRRSSGGAAIVAGPGCLMYSLVLGYEDHPGLRMLDQAHAFVLSRIAASLASLGLAAEHCGTSDLVVAGRKISGSSLRCKREHLLYHGTLLYNFDLTLIGKLLYMPPRQPDYRAGREHGQFVANLPADADALRRALAAAFGASAPLADWPRVPAERLAAMKYAQDAWNRER